jgi:hypothetical protein
MCSERQSTRISVQRSARNKREFPGTFVINCRKMERPQQHPIGGSLPTTTPRDFYITHYEFVHAMLLTMGSICTIVTTPEAKFSRVEGAAAVFPWSFGKSTMTVTLTFFGKPGTHASSSSRPEYFQLCLVSARSIHEYFLSIYLSLKEPYMAAI